MEFTKNYPNPVNRDKLREELNTANFIELIFRVEAFTVLSVSAPDEVTIDAIVAAHNASVLTATQQEENARQAALNQARDYLRKQLLNSAPSVATIYSNVKAFVDNNPYLLQIVGNELSLANLAFGWTVASMNNPATNTDRARYLFVIQTTLGILA